MVKPIDGYVWVCTRCGTRVEDDQVDWESDGTMMHYWPANDLEACFGAVKMLRPEDADLATKKTLKCAVFDCDVLVPDGWLFCKGHERLFPRAMRGKYRRESKPASIHAAEVLNTIHGLGWELRVLTDLDTKVQYSFCKDGRTVTAVGPTDEDALKEILDMIEGRT